MYVTQSLAERLWCHRSVGEQDKTYRSTCVGAGCMAWRWASGYVPEDGSERRGYCGLAGDPVGRLGLAKADG